MELEGKKINIVVGVSKHLSEEMLMGRDIPHFPQYLRKELEKELKKPTLLGPDNRDKHGSDPCPANKAD